PFFLHETDIGLTQTVGGKLTQPVMVVQHRDQIDIALHQFAGMRAFQEMPGIADHGFARQSLDDVENLGRIFLVRDQVAEMAKSFKRAESGYLCFAVMHRHGHRYSSLICYMWCSCHQRIALTVTDRSTKLLLTFMSIIAVLLLYLWFSLYKVPTRKHHI